MNGQELDLKITVKDSLFLPVIGQVGYHKKHLTDGSVHKSLDSVVDKVREYGFINARIDTVYNNGAAYHAVLDMGRSSTTAKIYNIGHIPLPKNYPLGKNGGPIVLPTREIPVFLNGIVTHFEEKGYPFTSVSLKNIRLKRDTIIASLNVDIRTKRKIDKIVLTGYEDFPLHLLSLKTADPYSRKSLSEISGRIGQLPFVSETKPPETLFTPDSTIVYLYLKKEAANSFDGLIGFDRNAGNDKLQLNGYADLMLNNLFNAGERFALKWNNNGQNRQDLETHLYLPHLFKSKFSACLKLNILKQDSTFATTDLNISIPYQIDYKNNVGISYKYVNSVGLSDAEALTDIGDYNSSFVGPNYAFSNLKPTPFLSNGFNLSAEILYGYRKSELLEGPQWLLGGRLQYSLPVFKKSYLFLANQTSWLLSGSYLDNELLRLGGINNLRGFSYNSILASFYSTLTVEYRLLTNNNDYLFSITDIAATQNKKMGTNTDYFGVGLGYSFRTAVGNVNISYAVGNAFGDPFSFGQGQLQVKIVNTF